MFAYWNPMCQYSGCFFFFQAEDGIRDVAVTGVQTCALPIFAGDGAAGGDTDFQNLEGEREGGVFLPVDSAIVQNQRMEIAVASVKNVGNAQAVFSAEP